ncbi:MAG: hypothetical protein ACYTFT_16600, partial [Planctomycetota bacterium]
ALLLVGPLTVATLARQALIARGHYRAALAGALAGAAALTALGPVLARSHGAVGALAAAGIGLAVSAVALCGLLDWEAGSKTALAQLGPALVAVAACAAALALIPGAL